MNSTYTAVTPEDRQIMLAQIGVKTVEELFENIPSSLRLDRGSDLPQGLSEQEVYQHLAELAAKNISCEEEISFLGGGMYDHYVPALIDMLLERSEFLTPYTPYQPEISQGSLQAMFEYQTAISELTALPVANASLYDGPSAVGAAGYLAKLVNGRKKLVVSAGLHPHSIATLKTLSRGYGMDVVEVPLQVNGLTDQGALAEVLAEDVAAVFLQQPNVFGVLEDIEHLTELIHTKTSNDGARPQHALAVTAVDPIVLGVIKAPGECGVDIALGEGQPLGNRLDFGGPSFGFFAAREEYIRKMPGRIAGRVDVDGRRGFVLTLQTREQHIRREKATSNICTAQALNALAGTIYLSWLGRRGIVELGELLIDAQHTHASVLQEFLVLNFFTISQLHVSLLLRCQYLHKP